VPGITKKSLVFVWWFPAGLIFVAGHIMGYREKGDLPLILTSLFGFHMMIVNGIARRIAGGHQRLHEQQRVRDNTGYPDGIGFKGISARAEPAFRIPQAFFKDGFAGKNANPLL
jgi:hypothetical protein